MVRPLLMGMRRLVATLSREDIHSKAIIHHKAILLLSRYVIGNPLCRCANSNKTSRRIIPQDNNHNRAGTIRRTVKVYVCTCFSDLPTYTTDDPADAIPATTATEAGRR